MKNSKTKKILSILLAVIMVVGMIPATAIPAYAADEATCPIEGATGTGTEEDPIIVDTYEELKAALIKDNKEWHIRVDNNIICTGSYLDDGYRESYLYEKATMLVLGEKTLIVNGTIESTEAGMTTMFLSTDADLTIKGSGKIKSNGMCIDSTFYQDSANSFIVEGSVTFEGNNNETFTSIGNKLTGIINIMCVYPILVDGGIFINKNNESNTIFDGDKATLKGGSFPNGLSVSDTVSLQHGYMYSYADGTNSLELLDKDCAVEVVPNGYTLGFATQYPQMPAGETSTHLDYFSGEGEETITFGFSANPLNDVLVKAGYTIEEEVKVVSSESSTLLFKKDGSDFVIDARIPRDYTIYETIKVLNALGSVRDEITHTFTVSVKPRGTENSPLGSRCNPYIVTTDEEFRDAFANSTGDELYIKFGKNIVNKIKDLDIFIDKKVVIDTNGYDYEDLYGDTFIKVETGASLTITGSGTVDLHEIINNGTLIVKNGSELEYALKDNSVQNTGTGVEVFYDGTYWFGFASTSTHIMYGGTRLGIFHYEPYNNYEYYADFYLYGGKFQSNSTINGQRVGVTYDIAAADSRYDFDYSNVNMNKFLATEGDGDFTVIDDIEDFINYGKYRTDFTIAAPGFVEQYPRMPYGQTSCNLGKVQEESYPIYFNANGLGKEFIDAGYYMYETLQIYNDEGKRVYSTSNNASNGKGIYYDLNNLPDDDYIIIETVALKDKKGKTVLENTNTFEIKWKQQILIDEVNIEVANPYDQTAHIRGEVQTKGVNLDLAKWFLVNTDGTLTENGSKIFVPGNTYRYVVDLGLDEHYVFANGYTVKINGEYASRNEDGTWYKDFVARKKLKPIVEQDTYFFQSGTTREIRVDAHGDGVTYSWTGVSDGAGGYYTVSDYTERVQRLRIPEGAEGTNKYLVRFTDEYGDTAERMITVHITSLGFKEIKPTPTAEQFEAGVTDYGYVFPGEDGLGVPKVYFEAYELSQGYIDEGYTMETSLIDYVDGVKVGEGYEAWEYTTHLPGAHEIVQKIVIKDAEGNVFKEYTYTHKMNVMREFALLTAAYGTALYGYRVEVYQDGKLVSAQTNDNDITMDVVAPVGDVKIVVSKNGYKAREYEATIPADGFFSLNAEILRWGDANLDDALDVQDYQQTVNKGLSDNYKLDGSYEQSLIDWEEDGYIDVLDCSYCVLCINGTDLFSASVEQDKYYGTSGETIKIPVTAEGYGITYEWKAPEGAPAIVDGTEDEATVKIGIESGKYNIGDKFTYTCIVRDRFFSYAELEVELEIEHLTNLYAVTYSSQYEDITGLPGKTRIKAGDSITIPELIPQLEGYTFMYWYAGSDRLNPGDTYTPYQNTIIMPYMAKDYEITLYSGYEGELFGTHIGNYGHYYYLPEMDYMPEGYVFYGWTTVEGSNEVEYKAGDRYTIRGDVSFYPVIAKADDITLTIYANDGTDTVIYTQTLADEGASFFTIPEDLEMPTRDGYVCRYFYTDPNYVHGDYHEERLFFPGDEITADADGIELYVIWIGEYSVTYDSGTDDNNVYVPYPEMYEYGDYARISTDKPYREGYNFLYWEDADGTKYYGDEYISVKSAIVLTAVWEKADHYDIWVGGQRVSKSDPVVQCGDGTATVIDDNGNLTLVLNNATITGSEGIRTTYYSLDVEVYGENTISLYGNDVKGMDINGYFYISGTGTLNIDVMGDGAIGINGLYSIDYVTVNVEATPETSDGEAIGVTANSGSTYSMHFNNGAVLNATGTYGIYNAGSMYADITSKVNVEGTKYGIYSVADFMSFGGTFVGKGDIAAIRSTNMYFYSYHPRSMVTEYNTNKSNFSFTKKTWDGDEYFCDGDSGEHGYKYVTVHPAECKGEHSLDVYKGYAATCEKNGLLDSSYCTACGYVVYEREVIPALGHNYNTYAGGKAPTCTEQGIKGTYTQCDNCGDYQGEVEFIEPTWHSWGEWIFVENHWYEEYGYGEKLYVRYCNDCNEYQETWYWYDNPNDTGSPNDWESGGAGPGKP